MLDVLKKDEKKLSTDYTDYTDYKIKKIRVNSCNSWAKKNTKEVKNGNKSQSQCSPVV